MTKRILVVEDQEDNRQILRDIQERMAREARVSWIALGAERVDERRKCVDERHRPLIELFSAEFAKRYPVRDVSTYGRPGLSPAPRGKM